MERKISIILTIVVFALLLVLGIYLLYIGRLFFGVFHVIVSTIMLTLLTREINDIINEKNTKKALKRLENARKNDLRGEA